MRTIATIVGVISVLSGAALAYAWNSAAGPALASRPLGRGLENSRDRNSARSADSSISAL